jgi:hypothetical protein
MGEDYERYLEQLARTRAPAEAMARELIDEGRYEEAEEAVRKLFRARLEALVAAGITPANRSLVETVFRHATAWAESNFPEPHTRIEADQYAVGRVEARAQLVRLLGYDPDDP